MRNDDSPSGSLYETFTSAAFRAHQYGIPTIGWESDILSLTPAATEAFFKAYYGPGRATIGIVGDINPKEVMTLDREYVREDTRRDLRRLRSSPSSRLSEGSGASKSNSTPNRRWRSGSTSPASVIPMICVRCHR